MLILHMLILFGHIPSVLTSVFYRNISGGGNDLNFYAAALDLVTYVISTVSISLN